LLLNNELHQWIDSADKTTINGLKIWIFSNYLYLQNETNRTIIFNANSITAVYQTGRRVFGERKRINPKEEVHFDISKYIESGVDFFKIKYEDYRIMIANNYK
jgi:hypothetical protein